MGHLATALFCSRITTKKNPVGDKISIAGWTGGNNLLRSSCSGTLPYVTAVSCAPVNFDTGAGGSSRQAGPRGSTQVQVLHTMYC